MPSVVDADFAAPFSQVEEMTIFDLRAAMDTGQLTAHELTSMYLGA